MKAQAVLVSLLAYVWRKRKHITAIAFVVGLTLASQAFGGPVIPRGTAIVDGNLSDWAGATWNAFNTQYDGLTPDIAEGGWTARWIDAKVYMAVKVRDTAHYFTNTYTDWNARDAVEMYIHTTGTGGLGPGGAYELYQEPAQEWIVGMTAAANGTLWMTNGYPPRDGDFTPMADQFVAAGSIDGQWLYYEAAITPFEYFGGRRSPPVADVVSPLSANMIIGLDCMAVGHDATAYTGMKCSALGQTGGEWYAYYDRISQSTLPEPGAIVLLAIGLTGLLAYAWRRRK